MWISVSEAVGRLDERGLITRQKRNISGRIADHVAGLLGQALPADLEDLYRESIDSVGDFAAVLPVLNGRIGWREWPDEYLMYLFDVDAVPLFSDGCGSLWGLDLKAGSEVPAVYFYDHEQQFEKPNYAAGSSLGAFLLLLGDHDRAIQEGWPAGWELKIDPDIDKCPRASAIWNTSS
jgi:hypothetical protein